MARRFFALCHNFFDHISRIQFCFQVPFVQAGAVLLSAVKPCALHVRFRKNLSRAKSVRFAILLTIDNMWWGSDAEARFDG